MHVHVDRLVRCTILLRVYQVRFRLILPSISPCLVLLWGRLSTVVLASYSRVLNMVCAGGCSADPRYCAVSCCPLSRVQ